MAGLSVESTPLPSLMGARGVVEFFVVVVLVAVVALAEEERFFVVLIGRYRERIIVVNR
jgi:hypothetical protein